VRVEEIQFVARELFNRKNISLSIIGPFKNKNIFEKILNY
jgi:predicted Zn-dependent peptidase